MAAAPVARSQQKEAKRERIRDAAWDLFCVRGYDATTTREVAERAGVATGTVFLYARDKADLLFLVFEHRLSSSVDAGFASMPDAGLVDQLVHLFGPVFEMYDAAPRVARAFVKELPGADGPNAQRVNGLTFTFLARMATLVEAAQKRGEVRAEVLAFEAAQIIFGLYFMSLMGWLGGFLTLHDALHGNFRRSLELLMDGLGAAGRAHQGDG
jgi:TetR/AcrR family transcriptional regulator, cholesterol catabolism regulator